MNWRYVFKQLGLLLLVLSAALLGMAVIFFVTAALRGQDVNPAARIALFLTGSVGAIAGGGIWWVTRHCALLLGRREALLLVAMTWIFGAAFAALPYLVWAHLPGTGAPADHPFRNFVDCYFEAMSGITTTGATILESVEEVPRSLLLPLSLGPFERSGLISSQASPSEGERSKTLAP